MASSFMMNHLAHIFGILGNIVSFCVFLSPSPTFYKMCKANNTQGFNPLPYSVALFSCMLTGYYGVLKNSLLLVTINVVGVIVESSYLTIYMVFAPRDDKIYAAKRIISFNVGLLGLIILLTSLITSGEHRVSTVGWICAICSICVFVSPFSVMRTVVKTKSVEYVPFWLSFSLTGCAIIWFFYGFFVKDLFIALPNVLGVIFGVMQMGLYFLYKNSKSPTVVNVVKVEAGENATERGVTMSIIKCSVRDDVEKLPIVMECVV